MSEFAKIMRIAERVCGSKRNCDPECPCRRMIMIDGEAGSICAFGGFAEGGRDWEDVERELIEWDGEHPEPRYPTWKEWQDSICDADAAEMIAGCHFASVCPYDEGASCDECRDYPIPERIAVKLGLKKVGGEGDADAAEDRNARRAAVLRARDAADRCKYLDDLLF